VKKEVVIAIIIGCLLGLVITFGIRSANQALLTAGNQTTPTPTPDNTTPVANNTTPAPAVKSLLTITSPDNNYLSNSEKIIITGKTDPNMNVLLVYEEGEKIIVSDNNGDFSGDITLIGGQNQINVSVFDNIGNQTNKIINIVYSTAEI